MKLLAKSYDEKQIKEDTKFNCYSNKWKKKRINKYKLDLSEKIMKLINKDQKIAKYLLVKKNKKKIYIKNKLINIII
jgi:leucyl-tRNA synthetase